jgi:cadmium resistance protein CadD (predicted permease)
VSIAGALGANLLPGHTAAYLGLLPVGLGLYAAWHAWRHRPIGIETSPVAARPSVWVIAGVTLANGGDNAGVYVPVFARHSGRVLIGYLAVFLVLVGVWCTAGRYLTAHATVAGWLRRWGHIVHPVALITIGVTILITGGAFGL